MGTKLRIPKGVRSRDAAQDAENVKAFRRGYRLGLLGRKIPISAPHLVVIHWGWEVGYAERERKAKRNIRRRAPSKGKR